MPKVLIKRKIVRTINTKKGPAEKHSFLLEGKKGEFWADCFANPITTGWNEGDTQDMEFNSREYQGKTYWNIVVPRRDDFITDTLKRIEKKLDAALGLDHKAPEQEETGTNAEPPDDIPF